MSGLSSMSTPSASSTDPLAVYLATREHPLLCCRHSYHQADKLLSRSDLPAYFRPYLEARRTEAAAMLQARVDGDDSRSRTRQKAIETAQPLHDTLNKTCEDAAPWIRKGLRLWFESSRQTQRPDAHAIPTLREFPSCGCKQEPDDIREWHDASRLCSTEALLWKGVLHIKSDVGSAAPSHSTGAGGIAGLEVGSGPLETLDPIPKLKQLRVAPAPGIEDIRSCSARCESAMSKLASMKSARSTSLLSHDFRRLKQSLADLTTAVDAHRRKGTSKREDRVRDAHYAFWVADSNFGNALGVEDEATKEAAKAVGYVWDGCRCLDDDHSRSRARSAEGSIRPDDSEVIAEVTDAEASQQGLDDDSGNESGENEHDSEPEESLDSSDDDGGVDVKQAYE